MSQLIKKFGFPLKSDWAMSIPKTSATYGRIGGIFKGQFSLNSVADTYLDLSNYKKGVFWVNGHNLGWHWAEAGPQRRLHCPAPWLIEGVNTIVVLVDVLTEPQPVRGCHSPSDSIDPIAGLTVKSEQPSLEISAPANTVKIQDIPWPDAAMVALARLDPMQDKGDSWGVGLAVGWADGKYVQINARHDNRWGIRLQWAGEFWRPASERRDCLSGH